jgi:hypothetical protein
MKHQALVQLWNISGEPFSNPLLEWHGLLAFAMLSAPEAVLRWLQTL